VIILDAQECPQGSQEWIRARLGIPTASCADKILTPAKLALSSQRHDYLYGLVAEWATGEPVDDFMGTYWTDRGQELEPEARDFYEFETGRTTQAVGFVYRDEARMVGCSPDWLVGDDGLGELKCPKAGTHIKHLLGGEVPKGYVPQTQFALWVTGRAWIDFMSYHPNLPPFIARVEPDEKWQAALDEHMPTFVGELLEARERLSALGLVRT
jgi:hypothetical protein